jgi:hypothetical protein
MKEESKYYTPQIEEFCVGFEYEQLIQGEDCFKGFEPRVFTLEMFKGFAENYKDIFYQNLIRVKLLDSQDIIDCGFETSEDWSFKGSEGFVKEAEDSLGNMREEYAISLMDNNTVAIMKYTDFTRLPNIIFRGTIKNKHELQTILKQIGVL